MSHRVVVGVIKSMIHSMHFTGHLTKMYASRNPSIKIYKQLSREVAAMPNKTVIFIILSYEGVPKCFVTLTVLPQ